MNINVKDIIKIAGVSRDMAYKYLKGQNLPRLDKAILMEDKLNIPARYWVELKNKRDKHNNDI